MNVVLFQPQIPTNTGNIGRLCTVSGTALHLIRPLGFFLHDRYVKRAGLDYWDELSLTIHDCWADFLYARNPVGAMYFIETGGTRRYCDPSYGPHDYLVFGSETEGIPAAILQQYPDRHLHIPMQRGRSLNLANTAAIVVYEAWRQQGFPMATGMS